MFDIKARIILENQEKVLLLLQKTKQGEKYTLIGGRVEEVEYAKEALVRECYEEVGIRVRSKDLKLVHVLHKKNKRGNVLTLYFQSSYWTGTILNKEPANFKGVYWFPIKSLPAKTSPTSKHVIDQFLKGKSYSDLDRQ